MKVHLPEIEQDKSRNKQLSHLRLRALVGKINAEGLRGMYSRKSCNNFVMHYSLCTVYVKMEQNQTSKQSCRSCFLGTSQCHLLRFCQVITRFLLRRKVRDFPFYVFHAFVNTPYSLNNTICFTDNNRYIVIFLLNNNISNSICVFKCL